MVRSGMVRKVQHGRQIIVGIIVNDIVWYDTVWYNMVWYGTCVGIMRA